VSVVKRVFGIDGVDVLIHFGVTGCLMALADIASTSHDGAGVAIVAAISLVVFGIRRQVALRHSPPSTTGEIAAQQAADIEARLSEVDHLQFRVQELEERLDFAERLLAQAREPERLS
jgi:hypothetical protein